MTTHTVYSPLRVPVSSRRFFILNQNNYRNLNWRVLAKAKSLYNEVMREQVEALPILGTPVKLTLTVFPKTRRVTDLDNIGSIHCKFFQDALTKYNKIPDDDYHHVDSITILFGRVDKYHPRVEILIEST